MSSGKRIRRKMSNSDEIVEYDCTSDIEVKLKGEW